MMHLPTIACIYQDVFQALSFLLCFNFCILVTELISCLTPLSSNGSGTWCVQDAKTPLDPVVF